MNYTRKIKSSIGILAYNEEDSVQTMLESLFQQSLFKPLDSNLTIEVVVVPNGCQDNTAQAAQDKLEQLASNYDSSRLSWKVCEVEEAGKPNAWNLYVHQFSDPEADYLVLIDADIQFLDSQTLASMIAALELNPNAYVSVDKPVKNVALKQKKTLFEQLSVAVSGLSGSGDRAWICGQLYCTRATIIRQIYLPSALSADDSFIYKMVVSDGLTTPDSYERVVLAESASHIFEAYTNPQQLLRHEQWLIVSNIINDIIYDYLQQNQGQYQSVAALIKAKNEQDAKWVSELLKNVVSQEGKSLFSPELFYRRFRNLRYKSFPKLLFLVPVAVIAFLVDLLVFWQANRELRAGGGLRYRGKQAESI